jgi:hypothetical protein
MPVDTSKHHKDLIRIFPFWIVETESGYSTMFRQPAYSDSSVLTAVEAIMDTDAFLSDGHLSFWVKKDFKGVIKQGTPLVQVIPFKRDSWQMEIGSVEDSERKQKSQRLKIRSTFMNAYKNMFRFKKEYR